jgi:hypothetical protein
MSGGAPVPVPVAEKILCIADLKEAGSKKLGSGARGMSNVLENHTRRLVAIGRLSECISKNTAAHPSQH